eukprot:gene10370-12712_t
MLIIVGAIIVIASTLGGLMLAESLRALRRAANDAPDGYPRLLSVIALVFAGLCMSEQSRLLRAAQKRLTEELERQILPDGDSVLEWIEALQKDVWDEENEEHRQ